MVMYIVVSTKGGSQEVISPASELISLEAPQLMGDGCSHGVWGLWM